MKIRSISLAKYAILAVLASCLLLSAVLAADDNVAKLTNCAEIESDSKRLACYDESAGRQNSTDDRVDRLGAEALPGKRGVEKENTQVRMHLTRCAKNAQKKNLYYFENGQIWKQVSDSRVRFANCDFDVDISRDAFGYKMQLVDRRTRVRIKRIK